MAESLVQTADGEFLAMDPNLAAMVVDSAAEQVESGDRRRRPARAAVLGACAPAPAQLCEQRLPQMAVCSYNEIAPGIGVETTGVISAAQAVAA